MSRIASSFLESSIPEVNLSLRCTRLQLNSGKVDAATCGLRLRLAAVGTQPALKSPPTDIADGSFTQGVSPSCQGSIYCFKHVEALGFIAPACQPCGYRGHNRQGDSP